MHDIYHERNILIDKMKIYFHSLTSLFCLLSFNVFTGYFSLLFHRVIPFYDIFYIIKKFDVKFSKKLFFPFL